MRCLLKNVQKSAVVWFDKTCANCGHSLVLKYQVVHFYSGFYNRKLFRVLDCDLNNKDFTVKGVAEVYSLCLLA